MQLLAWHEVSWLEAKFHAPVVAIGSAVMGKEEMDTEKKPTVHYSKLKQGSPESCTLEEDVHAGENILSTFVFWIGKFHHYG